MTPSDLSRARWQKSSLSDGNTNCVEVATAAGHIGVRDSKNPDTPALVFPAATWHAFLATH